ncbi:uncharacterized protein EV422DRAFT_508457 [Fimicolochytrium jonesii]|uniref:uncharacterized protein n=1 Tax=Fimicolochytrium jonesii TaxID=1396493 RepID=UPI0022FEE26A|nr:uncharacterized protein EV422DRAFT_508457 [Fimicolochytrium jonesii]KAI8817895.1 hypothetical protein EV422DRAFT_508457 [Fimicolochytrium jonesii]
MTVPPIPTSGSGTTLGVPSEDGPSPIHRAPPNTPISPSIPSPTTAAGTPTNTPTNNPPSHAAVVAVETETIELVVGEDGSAEVEVITTTSTTAVVDDEVPANRSAHRGTNASRPRTAAGGKGGYIESEDDDIDGSDDSYSTDSGHLPNSARDLIPRRRAQQGSNRAPTSSASSGTPQTLSEYFTFNGLITLVITPFFQGMFYGFGEGTAKVVIGRWFGIDPVVALGATRSADRVSKGDEKSRGWDIFGLADFLKRRREGKEDEREKPPTTMATIRATSPAVLAYSPAEFESGGGVMEWVAAAAIASSNAVPSPFAGNKFWTSASDASTSSMGLRMFSLGLMNAGSGPSIVRR